jgi:methyl-accepting chemotaxis protein
MDEVVSSIIRVTDIMGVISAASQSQSLGVGRVVDAAMQMDHVTQQNAALVEEMAAAASNLKSQAQELVETVAVFKLHDDATHYADLVPTTIHQQSLARIILF